MLWILIFYMTLMCLFSMILFLYSYLTKLMIFYEFELFKIFSIKVELLILFDWMSLLFVSVVLMISIMVLIYSMEYMMLDKNIKRFMYLVVLFILSMVLMILSPNMLSILIGWDGLGLVSYCLVIFFQSESSFNSGMVTVISNRIGDIMILLSISMMLVLGSWNFMFFKDLNFLTLFIVIMIAFTKSAQIPFSSWLPLAMAAPTPVSSLVHSSTLVTAGVYLVIRFSYLIKENFYLMNFIMIISFLTILMAGLSANLEFDFKKIIAFSTLSQLGLMMFCLSLGLPKVSFFHLVTHAMFKSMLFMCAGVIIHNMMGNQDIRYISMVSWNMPLVSMFFNCASVSLCGVPFLSGFFSKDLILDLFLMKSVNKVFLMMFFFSMGLTVMYTMRLMYYSLIGGPQILLFSSFESLESKMLKSMMMLFMMSIIMGLNLNWILFSSGNSIFLSIKFKLMIYMSMVIGGGIGAGLYQLKLNNNILMKMNLLTLFLYCLWFLPMIYGLKIFKVLIFGDSLGLKLEMSWNEYIMGHNVIGLIMELLKLDTLLKNFLLELIMISYLILFFI